MKYIIAVVLSAILFCTIPQPHTNNSVSKTTTKQNVVAQTERLQDKVEVANQAPVVAKPTETQSQPPVTQAVAQPLTNKQAIMKQAGIAESDWSAVDYIITRESTWNPSAVNYLDCIGLYQACPGGHKSVLLANCPDWQTNSVCSLRQAATYAVSRYGSWWGAQAFWVANGWW